MPDVSRMVRDRHSGNRRTAMTKKNTKQKTGTASAAELNLGNLDRLVAYQLSRASALSLQTFVKMVGGPSHNARYIILSLIRLNPGVTQSRLSATRFRDKSSMSPVIAEFIAEGLVRRERVYCNNRPSQALFLTRKGEQLWARLHVVAEEFTGYIEQILGPQDDSRLAQLLEKLAQGLIELDEDLDRRG
jgi:DNA-binding MarR family transcriptional regulator